MEQRLFDNFRAIRATLLAAFRLASHRRHSLDCTTMPDNVIPLHRPVEYPAPDLHRYLRRCAD